MGNRSGGTRRGDTVGTSGRRDFLRKTAVAGTGAFAVPMIVTVDPADAQPLTSPPPEPPGTSVPEQPGAGGVSPPEGEAPGARGVELAGRRAASERTELPRTGADIDRMVVAGLAATAGGAALVLWSADLKSNSTPASDSSGPANPEDAT